jgi:tRNA(Ile2) C34 agmatinyltransferase TiaS
MARVSAKVLAAKEANRIRQQRFLENHKDEVNEKRREKYAERKEENKCPRCGKKLRSKKNILCKSCLEKAREYNQ